MMRGGHRRVGEHEPEGQLHERHAGSVGDRRAADRRVRSLRRPHRLVAVVEVLGLRARPATLGRRRRPALVLAGQPAAVERRPHDARRRRSPAQPGSTSVSIPRARTEYGGCSLVGAREPSGAGAPTRLASCAAVNVDVPTAPHLAGGDELVERSERLLDRRRRGRVGASGTGRCGRRRAGAGCRSHACGPSARDRPRCARVVAHRVAALGGQHDPVAAAAQRLAEDLLGHAVVVDVGGVEQRDAGVEGDVDHPMALGDVGVAPRPEHHRAERERADLDAAVPSRRSPSRFRPGPAHRRPAPPGAGTRGCPSSRCGWAMRPPRDVEAHHAAHGDVAVVDVGAQRVRGHHRGRRRRRRPRPRSAGRASTRGTRAGGGGTRRAPTQPPPSAAVCSLTKSSVTWAAIASGSPVAKESRYERERSARRVSRRHRRPRPPAPWRTRPGRRRTRSCCRRGRSARRCSRSAAASRVGGHARQPSRLALRGDRVDLAVAR